MKIHLPKNIENSIEAAVHRGQFPSLDAAMTEAARLLLRQIDGGPQSTSAGADSAHDPLLGICRDCAEEMDEIVANAMRQRREEPWRAIPGE